MKRYVKEFAVDLLKRKGANGKPVYQGERVERVEKCVRMAERGLISDLEAMRCLVGIAYEEAQA